MLHIKLKRITNAATWLPPPPPPPPPRGTDRGTVLQIWNIWNVIFNLEMGSKGQNSTFSELVTLHIKENHACSNIIANIFLADTPTHHPPGDGVNRSKFNFFRAWSCCISNSRQSRMQQHGYGSIYFAYRPPPPPPPPTLGTKQCDQVS